MNGGGKLNVDDNGAVNKGVESIVMGSGTKLKEERKNERRLVSER